MEKAGQFYDKLSVELDDKKQDFYEYEEKLDELMTLFGKEIFEDGLGSIPVDVRKKKTSNAVWTNRNQGNPSV